MTLEKNIFKSCNDIYQKQNFINSNIISVFLVIFEVGKIRTQN